ncbi:MAG: desampylase [Acidobacteriota bacterium]
MAVVTIADRVVDAIIQHALEEAPLECCGLLLGRQGLLEEAVRCRNLAASPTRFLLAPEDLIAVVRRVRGTATQVLGIYHSHPAGPEEPSERDRQEFFYPAWSYWIVSLRRGRPVVRCFLWRDDQFVPQEFRCVSGAGQSAVSGDEVR